LKRDLTSRVARFFLVQHTKTGKNIPNNHKIYQLATKYTKWQYNRPNGHKMNQHLALRDPPKFAQIWIFGLKIMPSGNPADDGESVFSELDNKILPLFLDKF
jgi:hypothetical protein